MQSDGRSPVVAVAVVTVVVVVVVVVAGGDGSRKPSVEPRNGSCLCVTVEVPYGCNNCHAV